MENTVNNSFIGEVTAIDADSGSFGTVSYSISSNDEFFIDEQGKLYTKNVIDREARQSYQLRITAIDGGKEHSLVASESSKHQFKNLFKAV